MEMREKIAAALKTAMKEKDQERLSTLRLINAAIKDREIAMRSEGEGDGTVGDAEVLAIMGKMVKQRQESARAYEEGGRLEMAERELGEVKAAIDAAIAKLGANSIRDMGRVMAELKGQYTGQMDFSKAGPMVKDCLAS